MRKRRVTREGWEAMVLRPIHRPDQYQGETGWIVAWACGHYCTPPLGTAEGVITPASRLPARPGRLPAACFWNWSTSHSRLGIDKTMVFALFYQFQVWNWKWTNSKNKLPADAGNLPAALGNLPAAAGKPAGSNLPAAGPGNGPVQRGLFVAGLDATRPPPRTPRAPCGLFWGRAKVSKK